MKTIGLIGGITNFSTSVYYNTINQLTNDRLGSFNFAKIILHSINYNDFKILQEKNDWIQIEKLFAEISENLNNAGADCILICSNTSNFIADNLRQKIKTPLIHIAEETAKEIIAYKINKVGLLGTSFTMENPFYKNKLLEAGIQTIIPEKADREIINSSILNEFTKGNFLPETKIKYLNIIDKLQKDGAQGIILGCTEISLLINQSDCNLKIFDTTNIHSKSAVEFAISA